MSNNLSIFDHYGPKIIELRKLKDLKQKQLSKQADISIPYLSRIEKMKANPSITELQRIFDALGHPLKFAIESPNQ